MDPPPSLAWPQPKSESLRCSNSSRSRAISRITSFACNDRRRRRDGTELIEFRQGRVGRVPCRKEPRSSDEQLFVSHFSIVKLLFKGTWIIKQATFPIPAAGRGRMRRLPGFLNSALRAVNLGKETPRKVEQSCQLR